jgi:hypothetical protein
MSNPLPLDANGIQMQVCIYDDQFETVPGGPNCDVPNPAFPFPPAACVQRTTCANDNGDALIKWP